MFRASVVQKNRLRRGGSLAALATAITIATLAAYAGHPMLSEDTGTQGRGNAELELGYAWSRYGATSLFLFQPQLSYGTSTTFDLIIQPSWTIVDAPGTGREKGFGDTNLDFKWRFYGAAPWSLGVRAGITTPTAQSDLGLPAHKVSPHGLLVLTADFTPLTLDANLGYSRVPDYLGARADLFHFSAAATYAANERLFFVLDAAVDSNPDSRQSMPPAVALLGLIYTARPGLDLDLGYRSRLNTAAPIRQFLLGITYRGAP
ncbi:MAG TPA: transporter [Steroidobacteraceae bacterium]|nr:transporter [Steroidobacteraceae bacterium]